MFFVDKRHWPEFGIVTIFLWIRGTGLHWYYYNVFVEALAFFHVRAEVFLQHVTVLAVIFSVISFVFFVTDVCLRPRLEVHTG